MRAAPTPGHIRYACAIAIGICVGGCATHRIEAPIGRDVPLPTSTPESERMDPGILASLSDRIAGVEDHKLDSILVVRNGNLVFEEYYNGYSRDTPRDIRSVTKSITSILTGIALDEGALDDVDEAAARYLTDGYPDARNHGDMTIRHLLTMRTGLDCNDSDRRTRGHEDRMYRSRDWVAYFLGLARVDAAGTTARYCTGGVVALGETIAAGAGEPVDLFAERTLFAPLGIENYRWERFDRGTGIDTGGHLWITPQGMAKIGLLVLGEGVWRGTHVVSAHWIRESIREHTVINGSPYGYLWWINDVPYGEKEVRVISARGNGGQAILIVPEYDLVAVTTARYYNSPGARIPYDIFFGAILPSVRERQPSLSVTAHDAASYAPLFDVRRAG